MLPLYIVIYISGFVGGTIGPLPYSQASDGMRQCEQRLASILAQATAPIPPHIEFVCARHAVRPANDPRADAALKGEGK